MDGRRKKNSETSKPKLVGRRRGVRRQKAGGRKRLSLAQNFLTSEKLVRRLVEKAGIDPGDTVIDIGAGRGIITTELARHARRVIAIEKDPRLARELRVRFRNQSSVEVVECDFIRYRMAEDDYKVFASIPYNQTAAIVRKLLDSPRRSPSQAFLIMQKEPARKFAGIPHETLFSLLAKPYFELDIVHHLRRTDFQPPPDVDSVMLRIVRRPRPVINGDWASFVSYGFKRYKPNLRLAYKDVFSYKRWKTLARELGFDLNATPSELRFEQWMGLFRGRSG